MGFEEYLSPVVYQIGVGGIGGFLVGYAIKKIVKILVIILGIFILAILYLGYSGIISVNYDKLEEAISKALPAVAETSNLLIPIITNLPFAGSFGLGFLIGLKKG